MGTLVVQPGETRSETVLLIAQRSMFTAGSRVDLELKVEDDLGESRTLTHKLLGPAGPVQGDPK